MSYDTHNILCSKTVLRILSNKFQFEVCVLKHKTKLQ